RTAFISGFRSRGIFPSGVRNLSEENLRWQPPEFDFPAERMRSLLGAMDLTWNLASNRKQAFLLAASNGVKLFRLLQEDLTPEEARAVGSELGVYIAANEFMPKEIETKEGSPVVQIHSVRPARRIGPRGQHMTDLVVEVVQRYIADNPATGEKTLHLGGCT